MTLKRVFGIAVAICAAMDGTHQGGLSGNDGHRALKAAAADL